MNILVAGGAGFIGSHTVIALLKAGHTPIIVDDFSNSEPKVIERLEQLAQRPVAHYEQDYQNADAMRDLITKEKIEGVIHFAAFKQVGESVSEPLKYYRNNVSGLVSLLEVCEELGITNFVFSSSCTVYGEPDKLPVTEDSPVKAAISPYGASKQIDETILRDTVAASDNLKAVALRYFNPIGADPSALIGELPRGVPANLIPFVTQTAAGIRDHLTIYGNDYDTPDGTCIRDYIHVTDLAQAHVAALDWLADKPAKTYDTFNIGTGTGSSILEVITAFEKVSGKKLNYTVGPRRPGDVVATYAAVDKAQRELGWRAEKDLETALADAWRWQQTLQ